MTSDQQPQAKSPHLSDISTIPYTIMPASPNEARSNPQEITIDEPADLTFRTNQSQISELGTGSATSSSSKPRSIQSRVLKKLASTFSLTVGTTDEDEEIKFLSERSATCILVNFISVGYILLPSGLYSYFRYVLFSSQHRHKK